MEVLLIIEVVLFMKVLLIIDINWYRNDYLHGQLYGQRVLLEPVILVKISICVL